MKYFLAIFIVVATSFVSFASTGDSLPWRQDVELNLNSEALDDTSAFRALMIITSDNDFVSKLHSPPESNPKFTTIDKLKIGEQAEIFILFTNPKIDEKSSVDVKYGVKITRPNKRVTFNKELEGISGKLPGSSDSYYLANASVRFKAEPTDPIGEWIIDVTIHDNHSHASIPLSAKFVLEK